MRETDVIADLFTSTVKAGGAFEIDPQNVEIISVMPEVENEEIRKYIAPVGMYRGEANGVTLYASEPLVYGFWKVVCPFMGGVMVTPYIDPETMQADAEEAWLLQRADL